MKPVFLTLTALLIFSSNTFATEEVAGVLEVSQDEASGTQTLDIECVSELGVHNINITTGFGASTVLKASEVTLVSQDLSFSAGTIEYKEAETAQVYVHVSEKLANQLSAVFVVEVVDTRFATENQWKEVIRIDAESGKISVDNVTNGSTEVRDVKCDEVIRDV